MSFQQVVHSALTETMERDFRAIFDEDGAVLEAQQRVFAQRPEARTVDINIDAPTIAMRALNQRLLERERRQAVGAA